MSNKSKQNLSWKGIKSRCRCQIDGTEPSKANFHSAFPKNASANWDRVTEELNRIGEENIGSETWFPPKFEFSWMQKQNSISNCHCEARGNEETQVMLKLSTFKYNDDDDDDIIMPNSYLLWIHSKECCAPPPPWSDLIWLTLRSMQSHVCEFRP